MRDRRLKITEKITATRRGIPAAVLVPAGESKRNLSHVEIVEGVRALRKRVKSDKMGVREMIRSGR